MDETKITNKQTKTQNTNKQLEPRKLLSSGERLSSGVASRKLEMLATWVMSGVGGGVCSSNGRAGGGVGEPDKMGVQTVSLEEFLQGVGGRIRRVDELED